MFVEPHPGKVITKLISIHYSSGSLSSNRFSLYCFILVIFDTFPQSFRIRLFLLTCSLRDLLITSMYLTSDHTLLFCWIASAQLNHPLRSFTHLIWYSLFTQQRLIARSCFLLPVFSFMYIRTSILPSKRTGNLVFPHFQSLLSQFLLLRPDWNIAVFSSVEYIKYYVIQAYDKPILHHLVYLRLRPANLYLEHSCVFV